VKETVFYSGRDKFAPVSGFSQIYFYGGRLVGCPPNSKLLNCIILGKHPHESAQFDCEIGRLCESSSIL
jgi:hypothetical protein